MEKKEIVIVGKSVRNMVPLICIGALLEKWFGTDIVFSQSLNILIGVFGLLVAYVAGAFLQGFVDEAAKWFKG